MRKLFTLKSWLSISETAKHLTIVFGEDVSEADVLRLALDGHLKLSVNLINHAQARVGKVVDFKNTKWTLFPIIDSIRTDGKDAVSNIKESDGWPDDLISQVKKLSKSEREKYSPICMSLNIDNERYLNLEKNIVSIEGIWDLPMIGSEKLDIEHEFQNLTNGPAVTLSNLEGAFLQQDELTLAQLQESFDDNEYHSGSRAQLERIKFLISTGEVDELKAKELVDKHVEDRKAYKENRRKNPNDDYYPAESLPNDALLVVRTDELRRFEAVLNETTAEDKPLNTNERNTLLTIIGAMCKYEGIDPSNRNTTSQIVQMTEDLGAPISDDTVRSVLHKIPNAVESRKK